MSIRSWMAIAAIASLTTLTSSAQAQSSTGELRDAPFEHRVSGDLGFFFRTRGPADIGILQPSFYGNFTVAHFGDAFLQIDGAWRFVGLFGSDSAFRALNPYVGARVGVDGGEPNGRWRVRGGVGFTLPLTNLYSDFRSFEAGAVAQYVAGPMQGMYDAWLGLPLNSAIVLRGDFEYRAEYFVAGADTAFSALLPVQYEGMTGDTTMLLQLGGFVGGRPIPALTMGVRLQAVASIPTRSGTDVEGYTSLGTFVRGDIGPGFVEGRFLMNLDEPFGFAFDETSAVHLWALQVSGGATF